jgi:hypothetical protein
MWILNEFQNTVVGGPCASTLPGPWIAFIAKQAMPGYIKYID